MSRVIPIVKAETLIPRGAYCYTPLSIDDQGRMRTRRCPFWELYDSAKHGALPADGGSLSEDGSPGAYCRHIKAGDWEPEGTFLLWDQVKECGVNEDDLLEEVTTLDANAALPAGFSIHKMPDDTRWALYRLRNGDERLVDRSASLNDLTDLASLLASVKPKTRYDQIYANPALTGAALAKLGK